MPLDGRSIERVPEPATHEPTLIGFLEELESTDLSQGVCSRRVQQLIHSIHSQIYNMTASELVEAKVHNPTTALSKNRNLYPVGDTLGEWRLLASEEGEPGEVIQRIYIAKAVPSDGLLQAVHAFTLLERANNDGCSVSLFNLGLVEDLDWKTVATQADETRPITINFPRPHGRGIGSFKLTEG